MISRNCAILFKVTLHPIHADRNRIDHENGFDCFASTGMNLAEASIETNPRFRAACNVPKLNLHNISERTLNTV